MKRLFHTFVRLKMALGSVRTTNRLETVCAECNEIAGWNALHNAFRLVCILTTIALVIWCCIEFNANEDVCEVSFKKFHEDKDSVYPDLTFVLPNRFDETALRSYDESFNEYNYRKFLNGGDYWDEKMLDVDFDKVSMRLEDYILKTCLHETIFGPCKTDGTIKQYDDFGLVENTLHFPLDKTIWKASIKLKNSIFHNGLRPENAFYDGLAVSFAYPNQRYRSIASVFHKWPARTNESAKNYIMRFTLRSMEVLRRRPKKNKLCYDMEDYDPKIRDIIIEKSGCRPIMWNTNRSEPLCSTIESFQGIVLEHFDQFNQLQRKNKTYLDPCLSIEKLQIEYSEENIPSGEEDLSDDDDGWFIIQFDLVPNNFKEIKQVRKYSVQSLVGNGGGYIGLCLGYALWNVPTIILGIWNHAKHTHVRE